MAHCWASVSSSRMNRRENAVLAAEDVLYVLGLPADDARNICQHPLPDLEELAGPGSAA